MNDLLGLLATWAMAFICGWLYARSRQIRRDRANLRPNGGEPIGHRTGGYSVSITSSHPAYLSGPDWVRVDDEVDRLDAAHDQGWF